MFTHHIFDLPNKQNKTGGNVCADGFGDIFAAVLYAIVPLIYE